MQKVPPKRQDPQKRCLLSPRLKRDCIVVEPPKKTMPLFSAATKPVTQAQLAILVKTSGDISALSLASSSSWPVTTSKKLAYELRHNNKLKLGRLNDALFEDLRALRAFRWEPAKIVAFLMPNSMSRYAIHSQLRQLMFENPEHWDVYISLSAFQGHARFSDVPSQ